MLSVEKMGLSKVFLPFFAQQVKKEFYRKKSE
jgi:hypothetical protein